MRPTTPVLIVGGGPTGLSLALGLARQGVRSILVERESSTSEWSRAPGIHVRTREVLRQWGLEEQFLEAGVLRRNLTLHSATRGRRPLIALDFSDLEAEADSPGLLVLEQAHTERLLLEAVRESGMCEVRFGTEAVGLQQTGHAAVVTVRDAKAERSIAAEFVVGCDGASSFVRDALGLPFDGETYSLRPMLADIRIADGRDGSPWPMIRNSPAGITAGIRLSPGLWRLIHLERGEPAQRDEVSEQEVGDRMTEVLGEGSFELVWASRFRIHRRASPRFRIERVLLAGDAAHVHSPAGGLGMNGGIQDAHNLAWKLANALGGGDTERLLHSYAVERQAVMIERVSRYADLLTRNFLDSPAVMRSAAFALLRLLLRHTSVRRKILRRMTMLDLDYTDSPLLNPEHRAAGARLPNVLLKSGDGVDVRLYDLLPVGPVLLELVQNREIRIDLPIEDAIRIGAGGYTDPSGLLVRLLDAREGWILVRPDAHIAWARHRPDGMADAIQFALGLKH